MIPFYRPFKGSLKERLNTVQKIEAILSSGILTNGEFVYVFEDEIRKRYHADYVLACSSGTAAIGTALGAIADVYYPIIQDRAFTVELQAFTWSSLLHVTGLPSFADIDSDSWLIQPKYNCAVIVATHTFGNTFTLERDEFDGKVVYDAAESFGASIPDIGDATIFSFSPTKTITTCEGGAILTNDLALYNAMVAVRNQSCRMSEVHAIIGLSYMKHVDKILEAKQTIVNYYRKKLPFQFQIVRTDHSYGIVGCLANGISRDKLLAKGLETRAYYRPLTPSMKTTNQVFNKMLCLPCYVGVPYEKVVDIIKGAMN